MLSEAETSIKIHQVITACAFIHQSFDGVEKVFLAKRAATKKFLPGVYELPGGHIEVGEDIVEGLKREIMEEFGMHIVVSDPFAAFTYVYEEKGEHTIEVDYFSTFVEPIDQLKLDPNDHSEYIWVGPANISDMFVSRPADDPEIAVVKRGLELLNGGSINFGKV